MRFSLRIRLKRKSHSAQSFARNKDPKVKSAQHQHHITGIFQTSTYPPSQNSFGYISLTKRLLPCIETSRRRTTTQCCSAARLLWCLKSSEKMSRWLQPVTSQTLFAGWLATQPAPRIFHQAL